MCASNDDRPPTAILLDLAHCAGPRKESRPEKMLWHHFAARLVLALILGAFIGAERQWGQRMAGLRTSALVAAGADMFVMLSAFAAHPDDSFRIAGQVVPGISFLGAGIILRNGLNLNSSVDRMVIVY